MIPPLRSGKFSPILHGHVEEKNVPLVPRSTIFPNKNELRWQREKVVFFILLTRAIAERFGVAA